MSLRGRSERRDFAGDELVPFQRQVISKLEVSEFLEANLGYVVAEILRADSVTVGRYESIEESRPAARTFLVECLPALEGVTALGVTLQNYRAALATLQLQSDAEEAEELLALSILAEAFQLATDLLDCPKAPLWGEVRRRLPDFNTVNLTAAWRRIGHYLTLLSTGSGGGDFRDASANLEKESRQPGKGARR